MMVVAPTTNGKDLAGRIPMARAQRSLAELVHEIFAGEREFARAELSGIHNPWGIASGFTDPWRFLEACEDGSVVGAVSELLGPDLILWDSELFGHIADYSALAQYDVEGRYWPVEPLDGAVAFVSPDDPVRLLACARHDRVASAVADSDIHDGPALIVRYMAATSHFVRDAGHPAHRRCMEEQVLINYANRPLWLVSGDNTGNSDLVTGFTPAVPTWAEAIKPI